MMLNGASSGCVNNVNAIVVTRFCCPDRSTMVQIALRHQLLKPTVFRNVPGFRGVRLLLYWKDRELHSVSLWAHKAAILGMGEISAHVTLSRLPRRLGVSTTCDVYSSEGDWRTVLFDSEGARPSLMSATWLTGNPKKEARDVTY